MADQIHDIDQTPPSSVEAEEAVLGSLLINPECYWSIADFLMATDFFIGRHMWIFDAISTIADRNDAIDNITVMQELRNRGQLEDVGGPAYITYLINNTPTHIHAVSYGHLVERAAIRRRLLNAAGNIAQMALEENCEIAEVIDRAEATLFNATERRRSATAAPLRSIISQTFDQIEHRYNNKDEKPGLPTGFPSLDKMLNGRLGKGKFYIIAARPGMGKTAMLMNIAMNVARSDHSLHVAAFNLEMDKQDELSYRLLSDEAAIPSEKLKAGDLNESEWSVVTTATGNLCKLKITIDDDPMLTPLSLRAKCRKMKREHGLDLVIVDYIQLMTCPEIKTQNRTQEISIITRMLKLLARELNVPVIAASQLNRDGDTSSPELSHLRDSGSLEQDADVVMFIWRDVNKSANLAQIKIAKQRGGQIGSLEFGWNGTLTKFYDPPRTWDRV